jgi:hypothetical protein
MKRVERCEQLIIENLRNSGPCSWDFLYERLGNHFSPLSVKTAKNAFYSLEKKKLVEIITIKDCVAHANYGVVAVTKVVAYLTDLGWEQTA